MSAEELDRARGIAGRLRGYLPNRWPEWFRPEPIAFAPSRYGAFERACPVTPDGQVVIVPTPGHTPGHVSVVVQDGDLSYFLAGDATYTERALADQQVDGVSPSQTVALGTLRTILDFTRERPTVYLPTHDPDSGERMASATTVQRAAELES